MQKRSLGRGLSDLLSTSYAPAVQTIHDIEVGRLQPNPFQPRQVLDEEQIADLAASIQAHGILQPILVREDVHSDDYQIVAGERRWRAALRLELSTVPCVITNLEDAQMLEVALIENLQRDDLNPIEEAAAYQRLGEEFHLSQEEIAVQVGKSRSAVANCVRLLLLPDEIQQAILDGRLTEGHGRALLALRDEPGLLSVAYERTLSQGLNVRQTEEIARKFSDRASAPRQQPSPPPSRQDPHLSAATDRLQRALATRVAITPHPQGSGTIKIMYHNDEELTRLLDALAPEVDL